GRAGHAGAVPACPGRGGAPARAAGRPSSGTRCSPPRAPSGNRRLPPGDRDRAGPEESMRLRWRDPRFWFAPAIAGIYLALALPRLGSHGVTYDAPALFYAGDRTLFFLTH